jgi:hypothetical protein
MLRLFFENVVIRIAGIRWILRSLTSLVVFLFIIEVISEIIINKQAIVFLLLLVLDDRNHHLLLFLRLEYDLFLHGLKNDLLVFIILKGVLDFLVKQILFLLSRGRLSLIRFGRFVGFFIFKH